MTAKPDLPVIPFESREAWEAWLEKHHATSGGLWVKFAKKNSGIESVSHAEALDDALCYGWIDGQADKFDERYWLQRFTPRRPRSKWSKINRDKVKQLIEQGEMKPPVCRRLSAPKPTDGGMLLTKRKARQPSQMICGESSRRTS